MKKNLLTILLTILIIVLLLFLGNLFRNFLILKGICNSNEEFKNSKQGYHFTSTTYPNLTFIKNTKSNLENTWTKCKITSVKEYDLIGELV